MRQCPDGSPAAVRWLKNEPSTVTSSTCSDWTPRPYSSAHRRAGRADQVDERGVFAGGFFRRLGFERTCGDEKGPAALGSPHVRPEPTKAIELRIKE